MTKISDYVDGKVDAAVEAKMKELQKHEAKNQVANPAEKTAADRQVISKFYEALATGKQSAIDESNDLVAKDYKAKAQSVGTIGSGTAGGILVPTAVATSIIEKMQYISPVRQIATVFDMTNAQLNLPSENTLGSSYWVAEGNAITETNEVLDVNQLTAYKLAALDSFTREILQDAATNPSFASWVERRLAVSLALKENDAFVNGDGSGKPYGFRSSAITPNSVAQAGATLAYTDVTKAYFAQPTAYRQLSVWVTSSAGQQALVNLRDTQGRPLWIDNTAAGLPPTVLGRPVYIVDEIPTNLGAGTNATEIWFGYFENFFIGDHLGLTVDYGTNGTDFAQDKISLRLLKRVAARPTIGTSFTKLTGVISS